MGNVTDAWRPTLSASHRRRRHLEAGAPHDARPMSGAGKRAGPAGDPVGGSAPGPRSPRGHGPAKLNLAR